MTLWQKRIAASFIKSSMKDALASNFTYVSEDQASDILAKTRTGYVRYKTKTVMPEFCTLSVRQYEDMVKIL